MHPSIYPSFTILLSYHSRFASTKHSKRVKVEERNGTCLPVDMEFSRSMFTFSSRRAKTENAASIHMRWYSKVVVSHFITTLVPSWRESNH